VVRRHFCGQKHKNLHPLPVARRSQLSPVCRTGFDLRTRRLCNTGRRSGCPSCLTICLDSNSETRRQCNERARGSAAAILHARSSVACR